MYVQIEYFLRTWMYRKSGRQEDWGKLCILLHLSRLLPPAISYVRSAYSASFATSSGSACVAGLSDGSIAPDAPALAASGVSDVPMVPVSLKKLEPPA